MEFPAISAGAIDKWLKQLQVESAQKYHNMETETKPRISVPKDETLKYTLNCFPPEP